MKFYRKPSYCRPAFIAAIQQMNITALSFYRRYSTRIRKRRRSNVLLLFYCQYRRIDHFNSVSDKCRPVYYVTGLYMIYNGLLTQLYSTYDNGRVTFRIKFDLIQRRPFNKYIVSMAFRFCRVEFHLFTVFFFLIKFKL